jgi:zinc protease
MPHSPSPPRRLGRSSRSRALALLGAAVAFAVALSGQPALAQKSKPGSGQVAKPKPKKHKDEKASPKGNGKAGPKGGGKASAHPAGGRPVAAAAPSGAAAASGAAAPVQLKLAIQKATLDNGLRVVMNVDRTSPTVAVSVIYDVGARNELKGRSGFAHLFEHMMFQGSKNVPRGEHARLVSGHGGVLNGTTSADRTNYFEVVPANELALALWLEADRMKSLDVSEANFENQRKVVQEEYRMRVSNAAYVPSAIRLEELVYQGYWPYEHATIGSMADLDAAELPWIKEFHAQYYAPNNAVLTIAGDFDADEAMAMVHRYFDAIPKAAVPPFEPTPFPEQTSQRTAILKDVNARSPAVLYGWAIPPTRSPDHYALQIASVILGVGESSRLHQILVRDKSLAQEVSVTTSRRRGPDVLAIDAVLADGAKVGEVEKVIEAELKSLGTRPPSDAEMQKAHRRAQASLVLGLQSNFARASRLGEYEVFYGDARHLNGEIDKLLAVTKQDVQRVVAAHLGPTRRTIVETYPADSAVAPEPRSAMGARPASRATPPNPQPASVPAPKAAGAPPHKESADGKHKGKGKGDGQGSGKKKAAPAAPSKKKKP